MRANYDPKTVEQVIFEEAMGLYPEQVTAEDLCRRIVGDPDDSREMDVAREAIRSLRRVGLFETCEEETVKPTPAGIRAGEMLVGPISLSPGSD